MPSQKNLDQVKDLKEKLEKAKSVVLADYCGLKVDQINDLRQKIKEAGGEFKVAKNTLLKLAIGKTWGCFKSQPLGLTELSEPTGILFAYEDEIAPLKALYQFFQENELPKIKLGFLNSNLLEKDKIIELAQLPAKEVLQSKLVNILNSPISGFTHVLKGNIIKFINVIKVIGKKG